MVIHARLQSNKAEFQEKSNNGSSISIFEFLKMKQMKVLIDIFEKDLDLHNNVQ